MITAVGDVHGFRDFGTNDGSATGGIAGRIESLSETTNGAHNGLAFYTGQQSRTPYLQKAMQIANTGAIAFGSNALDYGSAGEILVSNGNASPSWDAASTVIGGPYLPLSAGSSYPLTGRLFTPSLSVQNQINTTSTNLEINYENGDGTTTNFKDFYVRDGKNATILTLIGSTKAATFA